MEVKKDKKAYLLLTRNREGTEARSQLVVASSEVVNFRKLANHTDSDPNSTCILSIQELLKCNLFVPFPWNFARLDDFEGQFVLKALLSIFLT